MKRRGICLALGVMLIFPYAVKSGSRRDEGWIEVRSPNFAVMTDGRAGQARDVALNLELVRQFFEDEFPGMHIYPKLPVTVLAAKDESSYDGLKPKRLLKKGELKTAGVMMPGPDMNYILLLLGVNGNFPYPAIYHEFTHLFLEDTFKVLPLWINEGLAQFYSAMTIEKDRVIFGGPIEVNLNILNSETLLPFSKLFAADMSSPYYNESHQETIFYAESWALTHYLVIKSVQTKKDLVDAYLLRVNQGADPVVAAREVFGNLDQLQKTLSSYITHLGFYGLTTRVSLKMDKKSFAARRLSPAESETIRGEFLLRGGRVGEAESLLKDALHQAPGYGPSEEGLGIAEMVNGNKAKAEG